MEGSLKAGSLSILREFPSLLCTVRGCRKPLVRDGQRVVCENGHSFDVARSGYVNLLQPQDRRSKIPGDTKAAVIARRKLHDSGVTQPICDAIAQIVGATASDVICDVGAGEGFYAGSLERLSNATICGLDISISAIEAAARRYPKCEWTVANADRFIPFGDGVFSALISITARMNPGEFARVLTRKGRLLIAVPAIDDLIELRGRGRERVEKTVELFAERFALIKQSRVTTQAELNAGAVEEVRRAIYRPLTAEQVEAMTVTLSLDLLLFQVAGV